MAFRMYGGLFFTLHFSCLVSLSNIQKETGVRGYSLDISRTFSRVK